MYTVVELAELMGINVNSLRYFVNYHPQKSRFFRKAYVLKPSFNPNVKKEYKFKRIMYVLDDDKLDAFKYFYEHQRLKRPKTNGLDGSKRLTWTETAIDCYNAHCICANCQNQRTCARLEKHTHARHMKEAVIELFTQLGAPPERIEK